MSERLRACPVCGRTICYVDGYASPALFVLARIEQPRDEWKLNRVEHKVVGCEACYGKPRAPAAPPPRRTGVLAKPPRETRPVRQIVKDDVTAALDLVLEGLDVADGARAFWDRLTGKGVGLPKKG